MGSESPWLRENSVDFKGVRTTVSAVSGTELRDFESTKETPSQFTVVQTRLHKIYNGKPKTFYSIILIAV